ncbi:sialidase family protein [Luteolibacter luteus]|uniref:sialidase family protein n=1 Tax=Luteolibacter luteus TaxID=2728835 RepID=UPI00197C2E2B|nr:sialidase family protein [Luteolibacter luteus]
MIRSLHFLRLLAFLPVSLTLCSALAASPPPPGIVIHHSHASSGLYIGSPSLCVLPDGTYLASHDLFGPASKEHELAKGRLYRSTDRGASWSHVRDFEGFFWQGLFVHRDAVYVLGTDKHHGRVVIRRSADGGKTWSDPLTTADGVLAEGQWHTAPMPVIEHDGRLWRAIEDAEGGTKWGERYRARMMSAPVDADLLDSKSWTFSNPLPRDPSWLEGDFRAWLEGNAVAGPDGGMLDVLRVDNSKVPEKAALVRISKDGSTASFDPSEGFIDFPGGAKKFTIRKDPQGDGYWSLATIIPERHADASLGRPSGVRNSLALVHSEDLRTWETRSLLLYHPDVSKHGFQYVDWQFDGDDLVAACRTAWDDEEGGAHNNHDANFLTFHRWEKFRELSRKDDVPMPELAVMVHEASGLSIKGTAFEIGTLRDGEKAFSNRGYVWDDVPEALAGSSFVRLAGGEKGLVEVIAKEATILTIATMPSELAVDLSSWAETGKGIRYSDAKETVLKVYTRQVGKGESVKLPRGNWSGSVLVFGR